MTRTCECGCGQTPPPAAKTRVDRGEVKGEPRRFVPGHHPAHHTGAHSGERPVRRADPAAVKAADLTEFYRLSRPKRKPCSLGLARLELPDNELAQLDAAAAADPGVITSQSIVEWLARRGHQTSAAATASHRRGTCACRDE